MEDMGGGERKETERDSYERKRKPVDLLPDACYASAVNVSKPGGELCANCVCPISCCR